MHSGAWREDKVSEPNGAYSEFFRTFRTERVAKMTDNETEEPDATHQTLNRNRPFCFTNTRLLSLCTVSQSVQLYGVCS